MTTLQEALIKKFGDQAAVDRAMKRALRRKPALVTPRHRYACQGGPYDGRILSLTESRTAVFTLGDGTRGRYTGRSPDAGKGREPTRHFPKLIPIYWKGV